MRMRERVIPSGSVSPERLVAAVGAEIRELTESPFTEVFEHADVVSRARPAARYIQVVFIVSPRVPEPVRQPG